MRKSFYVLGAALALSFGLFGCGGDDGDPGPQGAPGVAGPPGPPGPGGGGAGTAGSPAGDLTGTVQSITIDSAAGQKVTVTFALKDAAGNPVVGAEASEFDFGVAKLVPATTAKPASWQSYINRSTRGFSGTGQPVLAATQERGRPTAVAGQTGVYQYTMCTPLASVATFQYYGSGTEPAGSCATAAVARSGVLSGAGWDAVKGGLDLAYNASATTRLVIVGRLPSLVNVIQDFVPASLPTLQAAKANMVVTTESCGACHAESSQARGKIVIGEKGGGHFGRRFHVEVCATCHNPGSFDPGVSTAASWQTVDLKVLVHQMHGGAGAHAIHAYTQDAPFGGVGAIGAGWQGSPKPTSALTAQELASGTAAKGVINCRTCHDNQNPEILPQQPAARAAADKMAWAENLSQQACGSCHNGAIATAVDFSNHFGNQPGNEQCALCHGPGRSEPVPVNHATPYSTANNPELIPGAKKVEYQIASVTVNAANGRPTVKFRIMVDGAPLNLKSLPTGGVSIGAVNMRLAWSAPMPAPTPTAYSDPVGWSGPGIANPLDWNQFGTTAGRAYWNGLEPLGTFTINATTGFPVPTTPLQFAAFDQTPGVNLSTAGVITSLVGPDAEGYFTTVEGINPAAPLAFPNYANLTLKGVALESYLTINSMNISGIAAMKGVDGVSVPGADGTLKRKIVETEKCNTCHERVGFHSNAGRWAEARYCATCHNPELSSSNVFKGNATFPGAPGGAEFFYKQQSNNFKDMLHSLHAGAERKAQNPADPFNFIRGNPLASGGSGPMVFQDFVYPAQISDCRSCHVEGTFGLPGTRQNVPADRLAWSVIDAQPALGTVATFDPTKSVRIGPSQAACGSCHNSTSAKAHFATFTQPQAEGCATCHGPGRIVEGHK
jgi:OmcA/MtrC family decaheme c-type cytochrome